MKKIEQTITHLLETLAALSFLAILVIVVTLVVLRYAFNSSITGANELITILFVYTTSLGAAVAVGRREHIAILVFVERLSSSMRRLVDAAVLGLVATCNGLMVAYSVPWLSTTGNATMPSTELPRAVMQVSIPLGCGLAVLYCLLRLVDTLRPTSTNPAARSRAP